MFDRLNLLIGEDNLKKIEDKTVLVVGLGGVGGHTVTSLVRSGIKNIIIIDFDTIDVSNINRQIIAYHSTIGKKKTDVMESMLKDINPSVNVTTYDMFLKPDNIDETFSKHKIDYVADACDFLATKKSIIEYCVKNNIKLISSMGTGNRLDPTQLEVIELKKTNNDPIARILRRWAKGNKIDKKIMVLCSNEVPKKTGAKVGSNSFVPAAAGLVIASYIINDIIDIN